MDLFKLDAKEAAVFMERLAKLKPEEIAGFVRKQTVEAISLELQMRLSEPEMAKNGRITKTDEEFIIYEARYYVLKDEIAITDRWLERGMGQKKSHR